MTLIRDNDEERLARIQNMLDTARASHEAAAKAHAAAARQFAEAKRQLTTTQSALARAQGTLKKMRAERPTGRVSQLGALGIVKRHRNPDLRIQDLRNK